MANYIKSSHDTSSAAWAAGAADDFVLNRTTLGYGLDDIKPRHEIIVHGMDGGNFRVDVKVPGDIDWRTYNDNPLDENIVCLIDLIIVEEIRVRIVGAGGGAAPVCVITSWPGA